MIRFRKADCLMLLLIMMLASPAKAQQLDALHVDDMIAPSNLKAALLSIDSTSRWFWAATGYAGVVNDYQIFGRFPSTQSAFARFVVSTYVASAQLNVKIATLTGQSDVINAQRGEALIPNLQVQPQIGLVMEDDEGPARFQFSWLAEWFEGDSRRHDALVLDIDVQLPLEDVEGIGEGGFIYARFFTRNEHYLGLAYRYDFPRPTSWLRPRWGLGYGHLWTSNASDYLSRNTYKGELSLIADLPWRSQLRGIYSIVSGTQSGINHEFALFVNTAVKTGHF